MNVQYVKVKKSNYKNKWKYQRDVERKHKVMLRNMSHQKNFVSKLKRIAWQGNSISNITSVQFNITPNRRIKHEKDICGRNTSNGRIYVNAGYHTWLLRNEGYRINGKFARKAA